LTYPDSEGSPTVSPGFAIGGPAY